MGQGDLTVYDIIERNSLRYKDRPAWIDTGKGEIITFGQIKEMVDRLAYGLQKQGCRKGDRIGLLGLNSLEYFLVFPAAAAVGAIVVPVNWRLSADEAAFVLNDAKPDMIFDDNHKPEWTAQIRSGLDPNVRFFNLHHGRGPFEDLDKPDDAIDFVPAKMHWRDGFVIIYTAAVDGQPRGALLSQGNVLCSHMHLVNSLCMTSDDVHLSVLPLFHVAGFFLSFCAFHAGCLNINLSRFDAAEAVQAIGKYRATFMFTFAPMLESLLSEGEKLKADIRSMRAVIGLESDEIIHRYQDLCGGVFYNIYGQTEASMLVSMGAYNDAPEASGRPNLMAEVNIMDDQHHMVPKGQVGEIVVRGPIVFKGYWDESAESQAKRRDQWHHTGDLGRIDESGFLWFLGRKTEKDLIKTGGENVYPLEVEKAILAHPGVQLAVVFGVPDPEWKEAVKAVCVLVEGMELTKQELIDFVGKRIAGFKKPKYVDFVKELPFKPDGTVDREGVKEMYSRKES